ncbi:MAG: hypothetical protein ACI9JM_000560 [Halioglobus sp.]|jgi:hypothetical protein
MSVIPGQPEAISAAWLSEVLGESVTSCRVAESNAGTTGRAVLEIEQASGGSLPSRLFVKLPPTDEMQRQFVVSTGMGRREVLFYQALSREVPMRVPHCYYAACDEAGEEYIMLLEHLEDSNCTFFNASTRYSLDYVREVLDSFARLHAAYWESPRFKEDLAWVEPLMQHEIAVALVQQALEVHAQSMPKVFREMGELYLGQADKIHQLWRRGDATLIHGDAHDANLYYNDEPGFLDWAICAQAPGMRDVGYFLAGTLTPDDQRAHGAELVEYYRAALLTLGAPAHSSEVTWSQYQWHAAYVWVGSAVTLAMGEEWQPSSYVLPALGRLHEAMETIGTVDAIRAAIE